MGFFINGLCYTGNREIMVYQDIETKKVYYICANSESEAMEKFDKYKKGIILPFNIEIVF